MQNCWKIFYLALAFVIFNSQARAQITPDSTVGTQVTPNVMIKGVLSDAQGQESKVLRIDGGTIRGSNLFQSFSDFNINAGGAVYFSNPDSVTNIFTRVTGANPSNINGTLGVLGNANLFFMNPNGIIFGSSASLDLKGSFLATTASAIGLANGDIFSANSGSQLPNQVLNVNPNTLLFNQIAAQPIINRSTAAGTGLKVPDGQSLLLVGGDVSLEGGLLQALAGRIELAGVAGAANVGLLMDGSNLRLSVPTKVPLANVSLSNAAYVNVSATGGGSIAVNAQNVNLTQGSILQGGISGVGSPDSYAGNIDVNASGTTKLDASGFYNPVAFAAVGNAGNINITTGSLAVTNGGYLSAATFGQGNAGNVNIHAQTVSFDGIDSYGNPSLASTAVIAEAVGNAGNINITAGSLSVTNGAFLATSTLGQGNGGNININANTVVFDGVDSYGYSSFASSAVNPTAVGNAGNINITAGSFSVKNGAFVSTSTLGLGNGGNLDIHANIVSFDGVGANGSSSFASSAVNPAAVGNAGNINITAKSLSVTNGAFVSNSTLGQGNGGNIILNANTLEALGGGVVETASYSNGKAGNLIVNVTDSITLAGSDPTFFQRLATFNDETIVGATEKSGLYTSTSEKATGTGGELRITTGRLLVRDGAQVTVSSQGSGDAGNLIIAANSIRLNNSSSLKAESRAGSGGNMTLNARDFQLRSGSQITTNATGTATGGNITINADTIVQLENSDITANAIAGRGGNITIATSGVFPSADSDITASSEGGINGIVNISTPDIKQQNNLVEQPSNFVSTEAVVASSCLASRNAERGKFVVTGNGGLPQTPNDALVLPYSVAQVRSVATGTQLPPRQVNATKAWKLGDPIVEASLLALSSEGRIVLTATADRAAISEAQTLSCN